LALRLDEEEWHSTISFAAGIPVLLDGTLELTFALDVDVASQIGRTFRLFDWSGVTPDGTFATVQSDRPWDLSQLYTTGEATLLALAGDFNGNGVVDVADYVVWRNNLGADESILNGGGDNSGSVDVGDYVLWKSQFMM